MGSAAGYICKACETRFTVRNGGGFFFDLLHCDACGESKSVGLLGPERGFGRAVRLVA